MKLQGHFSIMSMADLIQWARTAQKSGVLKVNDTHGKEIQVVFLDGRIICSSTNSGRETYSKYLLHLGLCSAADVEWGMAKEREAGIMFGYLLVTTGRLDENLARVTLTQKTIEDLCDVFLWKDGTFEFYPTSFVGKQFLAIDLDPILIVVQAIQRMEIWNRLSARIHNSNIFEPERRDFPDREEWSDVVIARKVFELMDGQRTTQEIIEALPFSRFQIVLAISELCDRQVISAADVTEFGERELRTQEKLKEADEAEKAGNWSAAVHILEGLVAAHPDRREFTQILLRTLEGFRASVYRHNFQLEDIPVVTLGPEAVSRLDLNPNAGFTMAQIDGHISVGELLKILPMTEVESLRIIKRLMDAKVIDFPARHFRGSYLRL